MNIVPSEAIWRGGPRYEFISYLNTLPEVKCIIVAKDEFGVSRRLTSDADYVELNRIIERHRSNMKSQSVQPYV